MYFILFIECTWPRQRFIAWHTFTALFSGVIVVSIKRLDDVCIYDKDHGEYQNSHIDWAFAFYRKFMGNFCSSFDLFIVMENYFFCLSLYNRNINKNRSKRSFCDTEKKNKLCMRRKNIVHMKGVCFNVYKKSVILRCQSNIERKTKALIANSKKQQFFFYLFIGCSMRIGIQKWILMRGLMVEVQSIILPAFKWL